MARLHQNNFATNLTSGTNSGATTSPLNSIPTIAAPFYLAFDATNINGHYEVVDCTSKTATNVNHAATTYDHTTAEEVRMVYIATEMDDSATLIANLGDGDANIGLYRQALINGNLDVWQRGTSIAVGTGAYTADRFYAIRGSAATGSTVSRQDGTGITGSYYCARVQRDSGNSSTENLLLAQYLEGSTRLRGVKLTLSFWARKGADFSATSDLLASQIAIGTAEDSKTMTAAIASGSHTLTSSWQKFTITTSAVVASNVASARILLQYTPTGTAGSNDYFEVAQVQLCAGDVALPFQPKSFEEELRACQRYCYGITTDQTLSVIANGNALSTTVAHITLPLPVEMRTVPAISPAATAADWQLYDGATAATDLTALAILANSSRKHAITLSATAAAGLTQWRPYRLQGDGTGSRVLILDAEL